MHILKPTTFAWLAAVTLTASPAFAQDTPPPPNGQPSPPPPAPPVPPVPPHHNGSPHDESDEGGRPPGGRGGRHDQMMPMMDPRHHGPMTFLGVGVEPVPPPLADQLNLPEGFGLMASYVVPGSAAEKAGVKPHDILTSLDDQKLITPDQLATLVHSFPEGKEVSLSILRKGQETKLNIKLEKQMPPPMMNGGPMNGGPGADEPRRHRMQFNFNDGRRGHDGNDDDDDMDFTTDDGPGAEHGRRNGPGVPPPAPAPPVREILRELRPQIDQIKRAARENVEQQLRREITILRERDGASRTTRLDLGQAKIVIRDDAGELALKVDDGKRTLVAKDPQGKVLFSGPVTTDDERKSVPSDVRARLEKLEHEQMPEVPAHPPKPPEPPKS